MANSGILPLLSDVGGTDIRYAKVVILTASSLFLFAYQLLHDLIKNIRCLLAETL